MRQTLKDLLARHWQAASAALLALQVAALALMGQPWVARAGIDLWNGAGINGSSKHISDWYTFSHILHGMLFFWLAWLVVRKWPMEGKFLLAVALETAWEVFENTPWVIEHYRSNTAAVDYRGDTILNSGFDTLWMALGFYMALKLPVKWLVATVLLFEIGAAIAVRDNLTLNLLTFIWPVEAILDWQAGA